MAKLPVKGSDLSLGLFASVAFSLLAVFLPVVLGGCGRSPWPTDDIRGIVTDVEGRPLAGARVRWQAAPQHAFTDRTGTFHLAPRPGKTRKLTAWMPGYFIGGVSVDAEAVALRLRPLPQEDWDGYEWVVPTPDAGQAERCGNCHGTIHAEWAASAHARSVTNRRFRNLYDGTDWHGRPDRGWNLLRDHPHGAGVCAACHAPTLPVEHPAFEDIRQADGVHALGVHCDFCHKIADARLDRLGLEHGRYAYDLLRPRQGQVFFGPLDDVDRDEDAHSPLYKQSRYCAACHEGTVFGVPVYTTYSEWLTSPARRAGVQCQDCHMKPTGTLTNIAPGHGGIERDPLTLASHATPGATPDMLRRAIRLKTDLTVEGEAAVLHVTVSAQEVGHKVPTGFVDRRLVLTVSAVDAQGEAVREVSGPRIPPDAGFGSDQPGLLFAKVLEDYDGRSPVPFWMPCRVREDTRLEPGKVRTDHWVFPREATAEVRVRLEYHRFPPPVVQEKHWPEDRILIAETVLKP
ncbi:MAG: carboxypeptidase-like regulatory domain-containing protein [Gemmatales bacterium]|nr:carboxypeptidase-like regulatory domain-containing protein [Gemmatales bacterium]MDW8387867.1 carboxypeptidase-like regulatory domain-containing protein [Gemmatales bacterium]